MFDLEVVHKPVDDVGRSRMYFTGLADISDFVAKCRFLEGDLRRADGSRWTARALVSDPGTLAGLHAAIGVDGPLEVIRLPVEVDGGGATYLWVSRNIAARQPGAAARAAFLDSVDVHLGLQRSAEATFEDRAAAMLDAAAAAGLRLVCNDPFGEWGVDQLPRETFQRMVDQAFYVDRASAAELIEGRGYTFLWHYMFGLLGRDGELLCVFMLARWPWGFEATYTIQNRAHLAHLGRPGHLGTASPGAGAGIANVLMFLANCLLLERHGPGQLVYGEANVANCRPCLDAGYEIVAPDIGVEHELVHQNVVWADNPIGTPNRTPYSPAPHFSERPYASYVLMTLNDAKLKPFIGQVGDFLAGGVP